jgi:DNA-binding transcriptional regulator YiaG
MAALTWQHRRTMDAAEYVEILKALNLSQAAAGRYLGCSSRTASRYYHGETTIPPAEVLLLRVLVAKGIKPLVPDWKSDRNKHW